jgi:hypothetical protein
VNHSDRGGGSVVGGVDSSESVESLGGDRAVENHSQVVVDFVVVYVDAGSDCGAEDH